MSYPYFYNDYLPSNTFTKAQLLNLYNNNIDYTNNKAMHKEVQKIKTLLMQQYISDSSSSNPFIYTYTSATSNDYFSLLLQKLSLMFPDSFIYYTRGSNSQTLTVNSVLSSSSSFIFNANTYIASDASITNMLFISPSALDIPIHVEQLVFSYNYSGTGDINSLALANIPLIFVTGLFELIDKSVTISGTLVTVTVNTKYYSTAYYSESDFGLTFSGKTFFTNANVTNINIITLTNIPLSKRGYQFASLKTLSINTGQNPIILPNTSLEACFRGCINFISDISGWNTINVIDMREMFNAARNFNINLNSWNTYNVTNVNTVFKNTTLFNNGDVKGGTSEKMNWTFKDTPLSTTNWHFGSGLTQANAPDSLPW